jgi:hypothetical protein
MNEKLNKKNQSIVDLATEARFRVLGAKPNAHVMYTVNKQGERTHYGVYDCELQLNAKGNFDKEQPAPQLLGDLIPYKQTPMSEIGQWVHAGAWCTAAENIFKLNVSLTKFADALGQKREGE